MDCKLLSKGANSLIIRIIDPASVTNGRFVCVSGTVAEIREHLKATKEKTACSEQTA